MLPTGLGALAAVLRYFCVAELFARIRTGCTHGSARFTHMRMKWGTTQNEIRGGVANLDAILQ